MQVFIESDFIEKINDDFQKMTGVRTPALEVVVSVLTEYGNLKMYIDCSLQKLKTLEDTNEIVARRISQFSGLVSLNKPLKELYEDISNFEQVIVFTLDNEPWHSEAQKKGVLCFTYSNYNQKISDIINVCNSIKIDLSKRFQGWNIFGKLKDIPKNYLLLNDNYILKKNAINRNYVPLVKSILAKNIEAEVEVCTDFLNDRTLASSINTIFDKFCSQFDDDYKLNARLVHLYQYRDLNFHDRIVYSNFFMIECPVGFNFDTRKTSNSKITVDSIFDKFSYNRMNNHLRHLNNAKKSARIID
ncbi:hypothetical protein [Winogradskyella poriferorum]|uniref:hypothetical protein n=1 Tax=Winogradskyella poriferorum TaxID=307627 RepID=UPI003D655DB3